MSIQDYPGPRRHRREIALELVDPAGRGVDTSAPTATISDAPTRNGLQQTAKNAITAEQQVRGRQIAHVHRVSRGTSALP